MRFGHPQLLHFLWLILPLIFFIAWGAKKKRSLINRFCSQALLTKLAPGDIFARHKFKSALMAIAFVFLLLSLAQPRWGYQWEDLHQRGVDIIVALDVSTSMLAQDVKPDRLTRAKRKVADLLKLLQGDRIGLVAFAGTSFVQCPLTQDYSAAEIFLGAIDTDLIPVQGTAIGRALQTSIKAFTTQEKESKAIILITDGEDQTGEALEAAQLAKDEGVKIFAIGIGQETGVPIPDPEGGFKKDPRGEVAISKLDEKTLQEIALLTGGAYVRSVTGDMDLKKIYLENIKQTLKQKEHQSTRRKLWSERFQWMLALALICLCWEWFYRET